MNEHQKKNLIDSYLLRQTTQEENQFIQDLRNTDQAFDQYVKESELAFHALSIARRRNLKEKLKGLDELAKKKKGGGDIMLLLSVLVALFLWSWLSWHYSPVALAERNFHSYVQLTKEIETNAIWMKGNQAFQQEQFDSSLYYFTSIAFDERHAAHVHARWNLLLAQLALYGPIDTWQQDMIRFSLVAPDAFKQEANALLNLTRSKLYQYVYMGKWKKAARLLKPQII